jgi:hypothetical protein
MRTMPTLLAGELGKMAKALPCFIDCGSVWRGAEQGVVSRWGLLLSRQPGSRSTQCNLATKQGLAVKSRVW